LELIPSAIFYLKNRECNCSGLLVTCGGSLGYVWEGKAGGPKAASLPLPHITPCEAPQALRSQKKKT